MSDPPPLVLLHEDDDIVAVQKPSGEPVIPARDGSAQDCVQRRLERQLGRRLWVVHRIDKDASGVVVFARNADAHRALSLAFEHRQVSKAYTAFVAGSIEPSRGRLNVPLHPARKGKTRPARPGEPGAQAATTEYAAQKRWTLPASPSSRARTGGDEPRETDNDSRDKGSAVPADPSGLVHSESLLMNVLPRGLPDGQCIRHDRRPGEGHLPRATRAPRGSGLGMTSIVSLLEAHPHTGRHHQIRVHLRSAGTPILFDPLYGRGLMPETLAGAPCARLALHARRIDLPAPRGEGRVVVEAPLSADLAALAEWLDACGHGEPVGA